ncbi:hypothetical protein [Catenulispora subtropica]
MSGPGDGSGGTGKAIALDVAFALGHRADSPAGWITAQTIRVNVGTV